MTEVLNTHKTHEQHLQVLLSFSSRTLSQHIPPSRSCDRPDFFCLRPAFRLATITDFDASRDFLELKGSADQYRLDFFTSGSSGTTNAALMLETLTARAEQIAILENVPTTLTVDDSAFVYV